MNAGRRLYSMVTLVVAGFGLVALPLLVAVIGGSIYVDRLARRSGELVREGVTLVRRSQELEGQLLQMERNARQYLILGQPELRRLYGQRHERLMGTLRTLQSGGPALGADRAFDDLRAIARSVDGALEAAPADGTALRAAVERFERMRALADEIADIADRVIEQELDTLERRSGLVRTALFWLSGTLVPITLALTGLFAWLILRPIRWLGRAIRDLGAVEPTPPIAVGGPPEIRELGAELERLRVRLDRSEAEKNRFLRHMSHELKTPLAAIREGTELIADGSVSSGTPDHDEIVDILRSASVDLQQLIENLLVLSAGGASRAPEPVEPGELVDEAVARHRLAIARAGLQVDRRVDPGAFGAFRALLQGALSNLIGNAVRFSPPGGTITVRVRRRGPRLAVEVADEGPGIAAADRVHVFEPFYQGAGPPRGGTRGTGVGLSVVRDCARAHEGAVEIVDGEFPGAHIRMTLQAQHDHRAGATA